MPSDAKKREQQRKKEAAKARQAGKKVEKPKNEDQNDTPKINGVNGSVNGSGEMSAEGKDKILQMKYLFYYPYHIHTSSKWHICII